MMRFIYIEGDYMLEILNAEYDENGSLVDKMLQ